MWESALAFLTENAVVVGTLAALSAIVGSAWGSIKNLFTKTKPVELSENTIAQIQTPKPTDTTALTVAEFIRLRRELKADLEEEFKTANSAEQDRLRSRIAELQSQISDPEPALAEAQARIIDLEARLDRMGNEVGGDRLAEAREAFKRLDYSIADEIFAEVEERHKLEVQQAARAAFGRGEIAEAEVRWLDAADHYTRAARLEPDIDTIEKAGEFLWRAGRHAESIQHYEQLDRLARDRFGAEHDKTASALNNLAESYRANGQYEMAEPLFRQALEIGRKTLGEAHPDYAIHLNNLAGLLNATGRVEEAEPLYREALETTRKTLGEAHPAYAIRLNNLAVLLRETGRVEEAEPLFREALAVFENAFGADHPSTKTVAKNLESFLANRP